MTAPDTTTHAALAETIRTAYATFDPIPPIRGDLPPGDVSGAYAVQRCNTDFWTRQGRRIVGRKIGLTSEAVQKQLGVDQPDYGVLFEDMVLPDGQTVPFGAVLQPRVEAEIAVVLSRALDGPVLTLDDVEAAVGHLLPAIEVCGSRIAGWDISIVDTIADNASSGLVVLGPAPVDPAGLDLEAAVMTLRVDGAVVSQGSGAACLGHPYQAVLWLATRMVELGTPLRAGDLIMTGALGPMAQFAPGRDVVASIEGLGTVRTRREVGP